MINVVIKAFGGLDCGLIGGILIDHICTGCGDEVDVVLKSNAYSVVVVIINTLAHQHDRGQVAKRVELKCVIPHIVKECGDCRGHHCLGEQRWRQR